MEPKDLIQEARNMGAEEGKVILPDNIYTATWVRLKCQFGCGSYGTRLTCPPHSPKPEKTRKMLDEYETAILIHFPEDIEGSTQIMAELERKAFLSGYHKAFAMGSGPCYLCDECDTDYSCEHPHEARPSMEACGINVYRTAREAGYPIEVVRDRDCTQNYYGLLLLD